MSWVDLPIAAESLQRENSGSLNHYTESGQKYRTTENQPQYIEAGENFPSHYWQSKTDGS